MAEELRYIMFSDEEFLFGIESYRRMNPDFLPNGHLDKWAAGKNGSLNFTMTLKGGSTKNVVSFTVEATQVTEILVRFCIENNIPIPRAGKKVVRTQDGKLALRISLNADESVLAYEELEAL
ncbi:MAG: hypothetical protein COA62_15190 [Rhodobiaceae bacterium]|nr:MAG: hypothetical protein COA62_15190 [Rhodobiaceae bacterium]